MSERARKAAYGWVAALISNAAPSEFVLGDVPMAREVLRIRDAMRAASEVPLSPSGEAELEAEGPDVGRASGEGEGAGGGPVEQPPPVSVSWRCPYCGADGPSLTTTPTLARHLEICLSAPIRGVVTCDDVAAWLNADRSGGGEYRQQMEDHLHDCPACQAVANLRVLERSLSR